MWWLNTSSALWIQCTATATLMGVHLDDTAWGHKGKQERSRRGDLNQCLFSNMSSSIRIQRLITDVWCLERRDLSYLTIIHQCGNKPLNDFNEMQPNVRNNNKIKLAMNLCKRQYFHRYIVDDFLNGTKARKIPACFSIIRWSSFMFQRYLLARPIL